MVERQVRRSVPVETVERQVERSVPVETVERQVESDNSGCCVDPQMPPPENEKSKDQGETVRSSSSGSPHGLRGIYICSEEDKEAKTKEEASMSAEEEGEEGGEEDEEETVGWHCLVEFVAGEHTGKQGRLCTPARGEELSAGTTYDVQLIVNDSLGDTTSVDGGRLGYGEGGGR